MDIIINWIIFMLVVSSKSQQTHDSSFFRAFECIDNECQRSPKPVANSNLIRSKGHHTTLPACRLVCGAYRGLWPTPTGNVTIATHYRDTHPDRVIVDPQRVPATVQPFFSRVKDVFMDNLRLLCEDGCQTANLPVLITVEVESHSMELDWNTDESYTLVLTSSDDRVNVGIGATTVYGARHALETLSQLFAPILHDNGKRGLVIVDQAAIEDRPVFAHRGLLIDTARNFLSVSSILRTIDGLAATKMNVLHWHATDSQSFPLYINSRPLMSWYGAYSRDQVYSPDDIAHIVRHAKERGVRVILELDSPSHAGAGWEWGEKENLGELAVCVNRDPWRDYCIQPPCGQLNPVNPNTFSVLKDIYRDMLTILGNDGIIHLGGDEVVTKCWEVTEEITDEMTRRGIEINADGFLQLWGEFHTQQLRLLDELKPGRRDPVLIWSSGLTQPQIVERHVDKSRFIIQTWIEADSDIPKQLLKLGYKLVMSTKDAWYLDHGFWGRTNYHSWRDAYNNVIPDTEGVLGGEACMWGEYVNDGTLFSRVWPRTAAVGERLWKNSNSLTTKDVQPRLEAHRERLWTRGIHGDSLFPAWCAQHTRKCD